jgi:hypothetical protein
MSYQDQEQLPTEKESDVRFEVFTAVTMKNDVFWDVTQLGPCMNRRFGGTQRAAVASYS